ncbi:hypothetical protein [Aeromonas bivalvium]
MWRRDGIGQGQQGNGHWLCGTGPLGGAMAQHRVNKVMEQGQQGAV